MTIKANKGEWSEFYAFLKILQDRKLFAADKNLEIIPDKFFVFRRVFRTETGADDKIFDIRNEGEILILDREGNILKKLESETLPRKVAAIFDKIRASSETTFQIEEAYPLMQELLCTKIKAGNYTKSDIEAEVFDRITDTVAPLGFSVKSVIGGASTLLNSSGATNFIFEVDELNETLIQSINAISTRSKIRDRIFKIKEGGGKLKFKSVSGKEFESNLKTIDTAFPSFLASMLLDFFSGQGNEVKKLTEALSQNKELQERCGLTYLQYQHKIKEFLQSVALGMVPSRIWDGATKAHGGYIVVRDDGIVICYHLYNRDEFLSYLYENTKFDTPSSSRHDFGNLYTQDGKTYINLNLQIRFIR